MPGFSGCRCSGALRSLLKNGYAECATFSDCNSKDLWWRVTDAGRHAHELYVFAEELKRELLGGGVAVRGLAMRDPDRRVGMAVRETLEMENAA